MKTKISEDTRVIFQDKDQIPARTFEDWLYGKPEDFPGSNKHELPATCRQTGLVRVGFVPCSSILTSGCAIKIRGEFYRVSSESAYDFEDHTMQNKRITSSWVLKKISAESLGFNQSKGASPKLP